MYILRTLVVRKRYVDSIYTSEVRLFRTSEAHARTDASVTDVIDPVRLHFLSPLFELIS